MNILTYSVSNLYLWFLILCNRCSIDENMDKLFPSLAPNRFFRINRSQIFTKTAISKIAKSFNHRLKLSVVEYRDLEFIGADQKPMNLKVG